MDNPTTIPALDAAALHALHILRIGGTLTRDALADAAGADTVEYLLAGAFVTATGPRIKLTDAGRTAHHHALARELDQDGHRATVEACYQAFLPINADVLQICTDWQLRFVSGTPVPNDHNDPTYDKAVLTRLGSAHTQARPVVERLADALPRYRNYADALADALDRALAGDTDYVTNPRHRCFHTVWFELHEDLLATLGIDRADEVIPQ